MTTHGLSVRGCGVGAWRIARVVVPPTSSGAAAAAQSFSYGSGGQDSAA
ncbi:hypothetical protein [Geodermatophilus ruber]|nr:hypothetical protein [Geodermatophilus ruber]